jgi:hypothetical protein
VETPILPRGKLLECCHIDEGFTQGGGLATKLTIKARKEKLDVKGTQGSKSRKTDGNWRNNNEKIGIQVFGLWSEEQKGRKEWIDE